MDSPPPHSRVGEAREGALKIAASSVSMLVVDMRLVGVGGMEWMASLLLILWVGEGRCGGSGNGVWCCFLRGGEGAVVRFWGGRGGVAVWTEGVGHHSCTIYHSGERVRSYGFIDGSTTHRVSHFPYQQKCKTGIEAVKAGLVARTQVYSRH